MKLLFFNFDGNEKAIDCVHYFQIRKAKDFCNPSQELCHSDKYLQRRLGATVLVNRNHQLSTSQQDSILTSLTGCKASSRSNLSRKTDFKFGFSTKSITIAISARLNRSYRKKIAPFIACLRSKAPSPAHEWAMAMASTRSEGGACHTIFLQRDKAYSGRPCTPYFSAIAKVFAWVTRAWSSPLSVGDIYVSC